MKVSLLVPVYGVERYIARCAESLFGQTYKDIEYIFVDDCTPDGSIVVLEEVLGRFPERRDSVRIIRHERNKGLGAARATALEAATGDSVMHVDSDDYMAENAVEVLCRRMDETGADVVDGGYARTMDGKAVSIHPPYHGNDDYYVYMLLVQNVFSNRIWGRLYRRRLYTGRGIGHPEGIDYGEDFNIVIRLLMNSRRSCVDDVVYYYRMDNMASYTHGMSEKNCLSYIRGAALAYNHVFDNLPCSPGKELCRKGYRHSAEFCMLATMRTARKNSISMEDFYRITDFHPHTPVAKFAASLFRSRCPYPLADAFYRMSRMALKAFLKIIFAGR